MTCELCLRGLLEEEFSRGGAEARRDLTTDNTDGTDILADGVCCICVVCVIRGSFFYDDWPEGFLSHEGWLELFNG